MSEKPRERAPLDRGTVFLAGMLCMWLIEVVGNLAWNWVTG